MLNFGNTRLGLPAGRFLCTTLLFFATRLGLAVDEACAVLLLTVLIAVCGVRCLAGKLRPLRAFFALDFLLATPLVGVTACSTSIS